ncbi:transcription factor PIF1-like [Triticum aestivum]|nr:transcription factor PIF1-like [Triticum aestivum]
MKSKAEGGPKDAAAGGGEAVEEWWRLWREGESGGCAAGAAAAHGYPQVVDDLSSVNAKAATASVGPRQRMGTTADEETADELWRTWREGHGSSAPQDSSCKNSMLKEEDSVLPCSAASRGSGGAQRHSSEQIDEQCSTLDHAIEYMKSLQQQIQVLSCGGYGMQQLLFPCTCSQAPHTVVTAAPAPAPAAPLGSAVPPPPPQAAAATPFCPTLPLPPQPAAVVPDLNPVMLGPPGALSISGLVRMNAGVADEMASNTSEIPFGGCPRCSFRRRAGYC